LHTLLFGVPLVAAPGTPFLPKTFKKNKNRLHWANFSH